MIRPACLAAVAAVSLQTSVGGAITFDFSQTTGPVKPVNGVGQPPMIGMPMRSPMFHYLKEAGIPYSRLHDVGGWQGQHRYVDIPNVFPDFDADENDPKNYRFDCTDILIKNLVENGVEPFYRLGVTIENTWEWGMKLGTNERIVPPKDFAKWARICEHVIRHYTEGWANGFKYKMTYWEIWNEPDNRETVETNPLWQAPFEEYVRFYGVVAPYLKAKFPHLKIGGYGCCGFYDAVGASAVGAAHSSPRTRHFIECAHKFLKAARDGEWPLDFFSYHSYSDAPNALRQVRFADRILNDYGFTAEKTERIYNEWLPVVDHGNLGTARQAAQIAAELIGLQNGPCDVACIYDARCGVGNYSPLFNPMTYEPHKAYYVYKAFNELRRLGKAVKASPAPDGVYATAATDGTNACVLVANISGKGWRTALDFGDWEVVGARVIDARRTYAAAALPVEMAADTTWLVKLRRRTGTEPEPERVTKRIELLKDNDLSAHWYTYLRRSGRDSDPLGVFTASNGVLKVNGLDYGSVITRKAYRDYKLTLEYRFVGDGELDRKGKARDGGILYHSTGPDGAICQGKWMMGFEYNIIQGGTGDMIVAGGAGKGKDSVYTCQALVAADGYTPDNWRRWHHDPKGTWVDLGDWSWMRNADFDRDWKDRADQRLLPNERPLGEWNRCELVCRGDRADYYFNGKRVNWFRRMKPSGGRIQLQSEAQGIEYRNIVLEPLD